MRNPWLEIPLTEYEAHMALPEIAQAQLLGDILEGMLKEYAPRSIAVLGCAGGNGFERISPATTKRVVGVDINPDYVEQLRIRFQERLPRLELIVGDVQTADVSFPLVELVFAALLLEYVDPEIVLRRIHSLLTPGGILGTVIQLQGAATPGVTPSPFASIQALAPFMRFVPSEQLKNLAARAGFQEIAHKAEESPGGRRFLVQAFRSQLPAATITRP